MVCGAMAIETATGASVKARTSGSSRDIDPTRITGGPPQVEPHVRGVSGR
jgi:hypothetical protein